MKLILKNKKLFSSMLLTFLSVGVYAQDATLEPGIFDNSTDLLLLGLAVLLLIPIYLLIKVFVFGVDYKLKKGTKATIILALMTIWSSHSIHASAFNGFTYITWTLLGIVLTEFVLIIILVGQGLRLLDSFVPKKSVESQEKKKKVGLAASWWEKINKFRPIEDEAEIELDHVYDGIKELDNVTPPWFTFGFAGTIIFAIVYFWIYHVSKSLPNQIQEFNNEMTIAEVEHAKFLEKQGGMVDENNVTLLTDNASIQNGAKIFSANCAVCHKADGGGSIGPNLTDEYWLHGGDVKDVFKTIKYGVLDKGMVAWKDDLSPKQIQETVAFIISLQGSHPEGGKAPEGELHKATSDENGSVASVDETNE
ncbi:MAG: c-type cytochrome [Chitinophagales bacterium]|nr:c-type cytochrome [Chitinophagales bacterium]